MLFCFAAAEGDAKNVVLENPKRTQQLARDTQEESNATEVIVEEHTKSAKPQQPKRTRKSSAAAVSPDIGQLTEKANATEVIEEADVKSVESQQQPTRKHRVRPAAAASADTQQLAENDTEGDFNLLCFFFFEVPLQSQLLSFFGCFFFFFNLFFLFWL